MVHIFSLIDLMQLDSYRLTIERIGILSEEENEANCENQRNQTYNLDQVSINKLGLQLRELINQHFITSGVD